MSAWIVSKAHIDAMIAAGLQGNWSRGLRWRDAVDVSHLLTYETAADVGRMLWEENHRSVNYRYGQADECPRYFYHALARVPDAVTVLKAIDCYEYQTCEHEGWASSSAKRFCEALRRAVIHRLPGYDEAPWGIDEYTHTVTTI